MTRLNTDNVAAFFSVGALTGDSPAAPTAAETKPFGSFLQRAGQADDTGAEDAPRADESDPAHVQSDTDEQDIENPTEPDRKPEETRDTSESTADAGNATPDSDEPEAADRPSDDKTDEQVDAANDERSGENTDGKEQATVKIDVTEIGSAGTGPEAPDDADSATKESQSSDSSGEMGNRHDETNRRDDRRSESAADPAAKPAATSGGSEQPVPVSVEPEAPAEEEAPIEVRQRGGDPEQVAPSEGIPEPSTDGAEEVTQSNGNPEEKASAPSDVDNPLAPTESTQGRRTPSEEPRRRSGRKDSPRADDRSSGAVAKTLVGQGAAAGGEQVNAEEISAALEETKPETQEKTLKPVSTIEAKTTSSTSPKGWSPEGLRSAAAPATPDGAQPDQVDRVRFVQRVARAFETLGDGNGSVRLRLKPPELGGLLLEVSVRNGTMTARIETETSAARTLLLDSLPALRERLAQQDIKVDSFDVDLADRSPDGSPQRPDDDRQPGDRTDGQEAQVPENQNDDTAGGVSVGAVTRTGEGVRLDVVI